MVAEDGDGNRITAYYDSALDSDDNHANACKALCKKMGWSGKLQGGCLLKGGQTIGMVWSWIDRDCQVSV